jgi:hypothetical protein
MRAGVREGLRLKGKQTFRVVNLDDPEYTPIKNNDGNDLDGGGHRVKGISDMLAGEINDEIERRTGRTVKRETEDDE